MVFQSARVSRILFEVALSMRALVTATALHEKAKKSPSEQAAEMRATARKLLAGAKVIAVHRRARARRMEADRHPPGAERITDRERAQRGGRLKGGNEPPPKGGLFDEEARAVRL